MEFNMNTPSEAFTPSKVKEFQKQHLENKQTKKYTLTILKDGIYQEVTDYEFE
jgi:hypothetical protein